MALVEATAGEATAGVTAGLEATAVVVREAQMAVVAVEAAL